MSTPTSEKLRQLSQEKLGDLDVMGYQYLQLCPGHSTLDGHFTADQLRRIADAMDELAGEGES